MACTDRGKAWLVHLAFYSLQGFLIAIAYLVIFGNYPDDKPNDSNIIDGNPGLSYRPQLRDSEFESVISYRSPDRKSFRPWVESLENFLEVYKKPGFVPGRGQSIVNCNYDHPPGPGQVCDVDVRNFDRCIAENYFDYHKSSPCVFLRLNTPKGWKPVYYNQSKSLPVDMPQDLKNYIKHVEDHKPRELNTIWVSCEGETSADKEFIGVLEYFPRQGFPGFYTINTDVEGYLSPLVAVHFAQPEHGFLINIKCELWARNIKHEDNSAMGGVTFGILVD